MTNGHPSWRSLLYVPVNVERYVDKALDGGFRAELMRKDLGIAVSVGANQTRVQPATALAHQLMTATCNAGFAKLDSAALGLLYDLMNGEEMPS